VSSAFVLAFQSFGIVCAASDRRERVPTAEFFK
jgi:hypothetical protein